MLRVLPATNQTCLVSSQVVAGWEVESSFTVVKYSHSLLSPAIVHLSPNSEEINQQRVTKHVEKNTPSVPTAG